VNNGICKQCDIADSAYAKLINQLSINGSNLDSYSESCFRLLMDHFDRGLNGLLDPSFYLSSIPPGYGKTEAIVSFVKACKDAGFNPKGGILIGLQSKDQISSLVKRLGLSKSEVGILTKDDAINDLGCGIDKINEAPVLITTQQMVASRTSNRSFVKAADFFFEGSARSLRVWDESFLISQPVMMKVDSLHSLYGALRVNDRFFAERLAIFASGLTAEKAGSLFSVDNELSRIAAAKLNADQDARKRGRPHLPDAIVPTLDAVRAAGGRALLLAPYGGENSGLTLIGAGRPLPDDLAPAIILDASGHVRGTYDLMEKAKDNLVRLPSPQGDYRNLELHVWRTGCGKDVLRDMEANWPIFRGIADAIMTKPGEEWLILGKKDEVEGDKFGILALTLASLSKEFCGKLHYVHWGAHMSTNAYAHIRNVVVVGAFPYGNAGYDALAAAATGDDPLKGNGRPLMVSEAQHNLLQGVLRSNARKSVNGVCGEAIAYLIVSPVINDEALCRTFPGAQLIPWKKRINPLSAEATGLVDYLKNNLAVGASIAKGAACDAIGINRKSLSKMLGKRALQKALDRIGVKATHKTFDRSVLQVEY
jgi:hypothetical protein